MGALTVLAGMLVSWCWGVPPASAQSRIQEPILTNDRQVILDWTPAVGDTLTPEERTDLPSLTFEIGKSLGVSISGLTSAVPVTGRGAGALDFDGFEIRVGNVDDFFRVGNEPTQPPASGFSVTGAFQFGSRYVGIGFSDRVDPATAGNPANYSFSPALSVDSISIQANGQTVIVRTAGPLPASTSYTVDVSGVIGEEGEALSNPGSFAFQSADGTVTDIQDIQMNVASYLGQTVTVVAQVYIPVSSGELFLSGFVQDGSGRGINLYGGSTIEPPVNSITNVVEVTGTVSDSTKSISLIEYTASTVAANQPRLGAQKVDLKVASDPRWEGAYIEVTGLVSRIDLLSDPDYIRVVVGRRDTLFTGYRVWRRSAQTDEDFQLLRTYSLLDSTWSFVGGERTFADPDSIIPRGQERDPEFEEGTVVPGPFNGFGYDYAVTSYDAVIDATSFPVRITEFENEDPEDVATPSPVFPGRQARQAIPLLGEVRVVPNPYNPDADYGKQAFPGPPRVQFVNLPRTAHVEIYSVAGDLVRELDKIDDDNVDSIDWDLKNDDGRDVAPGIYVFLVQASGETKTGRFVVAR